MFCILSDSLTLDSHSTTDRTATIADTAGHQSKGKESLEFLYQRAKGQNPLPHYTFFPVPLHAIQESDIFFSPSPILRKSIEPLKVLHRFITSL